MGIGLGTRPDPTPEENEASQLPPPNSNWLVDETHAFNAGFQLKQRINETAVGWLHSIKYFICQKPS